MRKRAAVVTILIVALAALAWAFYPRDGKLRPVSEAEGRKLLAQVRKGVEKNKAKIKNGCGKVSARMQYSAPDVSRNEEYTCDIDFEGESYKARVTEYSSRASGPRKPFVTRFKEFGQHLLKPGSAKASPTRHFPPPPKTLVSNGIYWGDQKTMTQYNPANKHAQVSSLSSISVMSSNSMMRRVVAPQNWPSWPTKAGKGSVGYNKEIEVVYSEPVVIGRQRLGRDECIVIEQKMKLNPTKPNPAAKYVVVSFTESKTTCWICPRKGFRTLRAKSESKLDGGVSVGVTNTTVRKYKPGVWGVARISSMSYVELGKERFRTQIRNTITYAPDFQLNVPKGKLDLKLKLPKGTKVTDEVKGKTYTVK